MRSILAVICLSCVGCYTIGNTPAARASAHRAAVGELLGAVALVLAGTLDMQNDEDAGAYTVHADNTGALIMIATGMLLGGAGLMTMSASSD